MFRRTDVDPESEEIDYPETEEEEEDEEPKQLKRTKISDQVKELKKYLVRRKKLQERLREKRIVRRKNNIEKRLGKLSLKD